MGKQQTRNTANSYDQNFDDTLRYIIDPSYREQKNKQTESYTNYNRFRQEAFDLSKNKDFLDGSENPHTFQGGLDINSEDPFNELRASRQGGWSELGLFGSRAIAKTGREIINTAGAIGGLAPAIAGQLEDAYTGEDKTTFLQTVFDNAFIKANNETFDKLNKEFLPVYVSDTVTNGGFTDKIFSGEFWATEGADGVGYLVSMLAPGAALKSLKVGNGIFNTAAKLTALKNGKSIATAQRALEMAGWSGQKVDSFIIPAFNTLAEAGAEARGFSDNLRANKTEALANIFNSEDFRNTKNSKLQELGQQYMSKAITQEEYESRVNNLDFEISEQMFEDQVASGMTNTFLKNIAVLAGPNYIQSKILYGTNGAKNLLNQVTKKPVTQGLKRVGQAFLSEGSEEVAQTAVEHRNLEMGKKGLLGKSIVDDYNPITFGEDFIKTLGTTEGQVAGFLGGILGSPISVIGGYIQDKKDIVRDKSARDKILLAGTSLNDIHLPIYETEIVYNYNNEPTEVRKKDENGNDILIPENVAKIKKALDFHEELSQVFDVAVEAGNTEIVNKLKEIGEQNLMMNFVGEDEMTIDAFKEHLKVTLPTENVEKSVAEKNLKRQHDLLEKAKHVRKEMISFNNMVPKFIKLNNETATENQTKSFMNDLQRSFINDSVELRELEKKKSELESENADLEKFTKVEEIDNPDYVEGKSHELDKKITKRTNPRLDKNNEELEKINKQIENNKKFINEEIWNNDFINKRFEDFLKEAKQIEKETSEEEVQKHDEIITQIDNVTSSKELEELNLDISNPIIAERYNERLNELKTAEEELLNEEIKVKEAKKKHLESFSTKEKQDSIEVGDVTENYTVTNKTDNSITFEDNLTGETITINTVIEPSENDSSDELYTPEKENVAKLESEAKYALPYSFKGFFKPFLDFMMKPIEKKGMEMNVSLNEEGLHGKSLEANKAYKEYILNRNTAKTEKEITDLKELLFKWLPINLTIEDKTSWTGYVGDKPYTYENPGKFLIRKNIIDAIFEESKELEDLIVTISGQSNPTLNTDFENDKPVKNDVRDIEAIKGVDIKDLELFHIGKDGNLVPVTNKAEDDFSVKLKEKATTQLGAIFLSIKNPLGTSVPVKLNINRVGELAGPLVNIYQYILKHSENELFLNKTLASLNPENVDPEDKTIDNEFYNNIIKKLNKEIAILGGNESKITLEMLIESIVKTDGSHNTGLKIIQDRNGKSFLEFKEGFQYSYEDLQDETVKQELVDNISKNKYRNVITVQNVENKTQLDFKSKAYLEYLFETKVLTTNLKTGLDKDGNQNYAFKQEESSIWLEPGIKSKTNSKSSKPTTNAVFSGEQSFADKIQGKPDLTGTETRSNSNLEKKTEKIRNSQNNSVSLQENENEGFTNEYEKTATVENKEVVKIEYTKPEKDEIQRLIVLNNTLIKYEENKISPRTELIDDFKKLKEKYAEEYNNLPKKCNL